MNKKKGFYEKRIKRILDFIFSLIGLILFSPFFITVSILIRVKLGSPIIFKQKRPGFKEKLFTIYKFRTMTDEVDENGKMLIDSLRLTKFGIFLRATSIDEFPELFNILRGDMSLVGPRPLLVEYLPLYNAKQKRRHDVKPGLSGLAQVSGRNAISWEEKFEMDLEYINNINFIGDCKIIILTVKKVFMREGINSEKSTTTKSFNGNKKK